MREICFYTILFLFCSVPLAAQEVPFEDLYLEDLISVPGALSPGTFKSVAPNYSLVNFKPLCTDKAFKSHKMKMAYFNSEGRYGLTNKLSLNFSVNTVSGRYRSLRNLYTIGINGGAVYRLSDKFQLKSGISYQYNIALHRWEWTCMTGFIFRF